MVAPVDLITYINKFDINITDIHVSLYIVHLSNWSKMCLTMREWDWVIQWESETD